jgi:UDP-N-acetylglucosamine transferase subunit ALG13
MIFVTVGHKGFDRLIRASDTLSERGEEKIIMQIGYKPHFIPQNSEYFEFVNRRAMDGYFERAEVIISHCSVSSILSAAFFCKPLILVPRLRSYKEIVDDHQVDFAKELEKSNRNNGLFILYDTVKLKEMIRLAKNTQASYVFSKNKQAIVESIRDFLKDFV